MGKYKNYVEYVKSHIQSDININKKLLGIDYSIHLGSMLHLYLDNPQDEKTIALIGMEVLYRLEDKINKETGKRAYFGETRKCGIAVNELWQQGDIKGLMELKKYAVKLILQGLDY